METFTLEQTLDDLTSRFIINVPDEELSSIQRVCFQIEQAHWFYMDFCRLVNPQLPSHNLKHFSLLCFKHCPLLRHWTKDFDGAFQKFMQYKTSVPVCGAILLNPDLSKILLVRGWKANASWGFPKGKINKDEPETMCAIREVFEETGFDCSPFIRQNEYIERKMNDQKSRLYIISGISEDTRFVTQTRKEIGDIQWHPISSIPLPGKGGESDTRTTQSGSKKFYMVSPYIPALKKWIRRFKRARQQGKERNTADLKVVDDQTEDSDTGAQSETVDRYSWTQNRNAQEYKVSHTDVLDLTSSIKNMLGLEPQEQLEIEEVQSPDVQDVPMPHFDHPTIVQGVDLESAFHPKSKKKSGKKVKVSQILTKKETKSQELMSLLMGSPTPDPPAEPIISDKTDEQSQSNIESGPEKTVRKKKSGKKGSIQTREKKQKEVVEVLETQVQEKEPPKEELPQEKQNLLSLLLRGPQNKDDSTQTDSIETQPNPLLSLLIKPQDTQKNDKKQLTDLLLGKTSISPEILQTRSSAIQSPQAVHASVKAKQPVVQPPSKQNKIESIETQELETSAPTFVTTVSTQGTQKQSDALLSLLLGKEKQLTTQVSLLDAIAEPSPSIVQQTRKKSDDSEKSKLLSLLLGKK
ncbi:Dcp2, box A domain-containing protein [Gorgonomyces haynaldii]|nr:Dcp2, box A domain-containing protein [Gorgonomyces haynaldii]